MKSKIIFLLPLFSVGPIFIPQSSWAQITLSASSYSEDFNSIANGLPTGWTVRTGATSSNLGTINSLATVATAWNSTTGNFRNVAAASGLTISSAATAQNSSVNRALAVRQTGSLGDPGAAFVLQLSNTIGFNNFSLSFKLQSLDGSATGRTVTWKVDYGVGSAPVSFTTVATNPTTIMTALSSAAWGSADVTVNFGSALDENINNVWIRVVTLATATGSSSRPTSAIDDFQLSYSSSDVVPPGFVSGYPHVSNVTSTGFDLLAQLNESGKTYFVVLPRNAIAPSSLQVRNGQDASGLPLSNGLFGVVNMPLAMTEYSSAIVALAPDTDYSTFVVAEDNFSNQSTVEKLDVKTHAIVDITPPNFLPTYPAINSILQTGFTIRTNLDEPGKTYFVVLESGSAEPSPIQIKNGQDGGGNVLPDNLAGTINVNTSGIEFTEKVEELDPAVVYDVYLVLEDNANNLQVSSSKITVTTLALSAKASQTISFAPLSTKTFGDAAFDLDATSSSGLAVIYTSSAPAVASVDGSRVTITGSGSVTITASQPGNENFEAAIDIGQVLQIGKASQTISFGSLAPRTMGDTPFALTVIGGNSGKPITFTSSNRNVATVSENLFTIVGAGTSIVKASQAGDENFNTAADVSQTLVVNKGTQTIVFNSLPTRSFGESSFDLSASGGGSGLPVTFVSSKPTVASIIGVTVTIIGPGTTKITASQSGNANYNAATDVSQNLLVNKAAQAIMFSPPSHRTFGDAPFTLAASGGPSGLPVTFTSSKASVATISGGTVTIVGAGTSTITAKQAGNGNYNAATDIVQTLTIDKASQSISFNSIPEKVFGDPSFSLLAIGGSSGVSITFTSSNTSVATVNGNTIIIAGGGTSIITARQAGNANFSPATDVLQTLTVAKAAQFILFNFLPEKTFGDASFGLSAKGGSSTAPVVFSSSNTNVATVSGSAVAITGAGVTTITASQGGSASYSAANSVSQILSVRKSNQSISFAPIADRTLGDPPFNITSTASSRLTPGYSTTSEKIVIDGNQITMLRAGRVIVLASQPGNISFNQAATVEQSFCIRPPKPIITLSSDANGSLVLVSGTVASQWFMNDTALSEFPGPTIVASSPGIYKVQINADDCVSDFSDDVPVIVTRDFPGVSIGVRAYPSPAQHHLELLGIQEVRSIQVVGITGCIHSATVEREGETYRIDIQHLASGIYFLNVEDGLTIHRIRFVKK